MYTPGIFPGEVSKQRFRINILLVYLLIFVSGSWRFNLSKDAYTVAAFLISVVAWHLFSDRSVRESFVAYTVVFSGLLLLISIYTSGSLSTVSVVASTLKLLIPYFIIKTIGVNFTDYYIRVITFLALFSLFGYATDVYGLFDAVLTKLPPVGRMGFEGFLYVYRFPWHIDRNNSIFFEPGAYQAFLNAGLFILFFTKTSLDMKKKWIYIAILLISLVTTFSTGGFLIFSVLFITFLFRSTLLKYSGKLKVVLAAAAIVTIMSAQFYSTLIVKVGDYLSANEYDFGYSAQNRSSDAKTDIKVFSKHIFGVGYEDYLKEFSLAGRVSEERGQSSNGVTRMLAIYGLPFSLLIFGSYFWALKKLLKELFLTTSAFVMVMMFLANESFYMFSPILLAIIASAFIVKPASNALVNSRFSS